MTVESMTGFARATGEYGATGIVWELRSVNGKGLETRLRLPPGHERLEQPCRQAFQKAFARGNIQATLNITQAPGQQQPIVNEAVLKDLAGLAQRLTEQFGAEPARADGLLALRGVLDMPEQILSDEERTALDAAVVATLQAAIESLKAARRSEGAALEGVLRGHVAQIEQLTLRAEADPSRHPDVIRARLAEQVALLLGAAPALDEQRLAIEAAFLASKADIREEIDRLKTHVASARALLGEGGPAGRKLDFLAQEFNRESNTLCSKSNAASVTAIGLELKAVVDQFREQVQNLE